MPKINKQKKVDSYLPQVKNLVNRCVDEGTLSWAEFGGEDQGLHYCPVCKKGAFNFDDGGEVVEVLSNFCPWCGVRLYSPMTDNKDDSVE